MRSRPTLAASPSNNIVPCVTAESAVVLGCVFGSLPHRCRPSTQYTLPPHRRAAVLYPAQLVSARALREPRVGALRASGIRFTGNPISITFLMAGMVCVFPMESAVTFRAAI
jgi:hypothetical protein